MSDVPGDAATAPFGLELDSAVDGRVVSCSGASSKVSAPEPSSMLSSSLALSSERNSAIDDSLFFFGILDSLLLADSDVAARAMGGRLEDLETDWRRPRGKVLRRSRMPGAWLRSAEGESG